LSDGKVTFEPEGRQISAKSGETLFEIAHRSGLQLRSDCGGKGTCGKCRVHVKPIGAVNKLTAAERSLLTTKNRKAGFRLACQTKVLGKQDVIVMIPAATRTVRRRIQIAGKMKTVKLNPALKTILIDVPPVDPDSSIPDTERVLMGLSQFFGHKMKTHWKYPLPVITKTPSAVRKASGQVTLVIRNNSQLLDIHAGDARELMYGVALDIGTSKLVGSLFSLASGEHMASAGIENPQLRFGEDIMTRLSYAAVSPKNLLELQSAVIEGINAILDSLTSKGIQPERIYELVVVGNTVMTSLFLGLDTTHLAYGPFTPPFRGPIESPANQLNLQIPSQTAVYVLPNIAGYVGADAIADIIATSLHQQKKPCLLIDIGTNTEVILGNREYISATSCAAGPAFEGAQIEYGMKAVSGAIERLTLDKTLMEFQITTIDDATPIGICGSGVVDAIAQLTEANLLSSKGRFTEQATPHLISEGKTRSIAIYNPPTGTSQSPILLSEHDISQLLLAKAAIQTGYNLLLQHQKLKPAKLGHVFIAGAFGNFLNPASAQRIGLIPKIPLDKVSFVGNTALSGAQLALLSTTQRKHATRLAKSVEFVDLARHSDFAKTYAASLFI
jgi:uncharacterized 2Fe-2S/4Fe-4S cluster protein (DUF4445 family)